MEGQADNTLGALTVAATGAVRVAGDLTASLGALAITATAMRARHPDRTVIFIDRHGETRTYTEL